jgi:adenylate cyclase
MHVWAEKFEGAVEDVFDLQDRLTESIVGAIEPSLRRAEIERARRKPTDQLDAYDLYLRAMPHTHANTLADTDEALRLLKEALLLDPNYAVAHAYAAWCHEQRFFRGGFSRSDEQAALRHAGIALGIGTEDPQALAIGAFVHSNLTHEYDTALAALDRALEMNGSSALGFGMSALVSAHGERHGRAIEHARKALRLSPLDTLNYHPYCALTIAALLTNRYEDAIRDSTLAIQSNPGFLVSYAYLAIAHAQLSQRDAAGAAVRRLTEVAPGYTISDFVGTGLWRRPVMQTFAAALREAGLAE